ncbi:hypothetical protein NHX12_001078 [Muraenolepis orangiensis]|uniref:Short myomegalin-like EB1 binding protein N-terminal domain-containing protein n=1 Tax=Muraenolepis orangiensis TaxID=630683 RepID=A0A9Q0DZ12_9TELE|nr:hypothetical protein NHX12_001078 [Muraenolepis orangiensis]
MSSRGMCDACCVCGGPLQGNQRRWLFGGQNRRGGRTGTPSSAESQRGGSSRESSPCSSSWSLASSVSLSRYQQALSSPAKALDLLSVLSHILGRTVPRGGSRGEFLCGKCVAVLERVFKFDSVIARVKVLSSERLQKLREQRDRMGSWVRFTYTRGQPGQGMGPGGGEDVEGNGYREMLQDNMSLAEYECWSERWDTCPYFIRTGKRCGRGPGCEGCDSLRVSDSDYESVCGVPRHLPAHVASSLALSRNKSRSMPLHWSSQASLGGSSLSSRPASRTQSVRSLDSLDGGADPFDSPEGSVDLLLRELKNIECKPVCSPIGSRIPLLNRKEGHSSNQKRAPVATQRVNRELSFEENGQNGETVENGVKETGVPLDLTDDFLPLHLQASAGRLQKALGQLGGQLREVLTQNRPAPLGTPQDSELAKNPGINSSEQDLRLSLREKDRLQQELEKEREVWRSREEALTALLREKEALLLSQKEVLESSHKEVLAMSDSVIGQGVSGGGANAALAEQLREKEVLLAACLKDREESSATVWKEVNKMTAALQEYSLMHKVKTQHN